MSDYLGSWTPQTDLLWESLSLVFGLPPVSMHFLVIVAFEYKS